MTGLLLILYTLVSALIWLIGGLVAGSGRAARRWRLAAALGWFPALIILAAVVTIAALAHRIERAIDRRIDAEFGLDGSL